MAHHGLVDGEHGEQWAITREGLSGTLSLSAEGLSLDVGGEADVFAWERVQRLSFPAPYSVLIEAVGAPAIALGFASTGHQRAFRSAMAPHETRAAAAGASLDSAP